MNLLRHLILACVLLAQVWPAQAMAAAAAQSPVCQEGCCAWLAEEGMGASLCACEEGTPAPGAPAGLPPMGGRELVPQPVWAELQEAALPQAPSRKETSVAAVFPRGREETAAPAVRLPVLFCAFLN